MTNHLSVNDRLLFANDDERTKNAVGNIKHTLQFVREIMTRFKRHEHIICLGQIFDGVSEFFDAPFTIFNDLAIGGNQISEFGDKTLDSFFAEGIVHEVHRFVLSLLLHH